MTTLSYLLARFPLSLALLTNILLALPAAGQQATFTGDVIALPVTKVGNLNYTLEFRLNAGSDPVSMDLVSAREIIPNNLWNSSEFDPATGVLTVPTLDVDGADYSGEFDLVT